MRLYYISSARMSVEQAHGIQIAKMCEAFALSGAEVTLVIPKLGSPADFVKMYGVKENFRVEYLPTINLPLRIPGAFALLALSFAVSARLWLSKQKENAVIYTRGEMPLLIEPFLPRRFALVWETHIKPEHPYRYRKVAHRVAGLVAITKHYAQEIPALWGVSSGKVFYAPDGVDLDAFAWPQSSEAARKRLGLPLDKKIVLYAGRIDSWKGVDVLLDASNVLPEEVLVAIIGGTEDQIARLRPQYPKVRFLGQLPYTELPDNQASADVLVLTGDPGSSVARLYTSPLKLFTYIASGVPVLAADLPSFRDVLSEREAFFFEPTPQALAHALADVLTHTEEARARAARALELAGEFSWKSRAEKIITFLTKNI